MLWVFGGVPSVRECLNEMPRRSGAICFFSSAVFSLSTWVYPSTITRASLPGQERRAIGRQKFTEHVSIDMLKEEMGGGERKENKKTFFALANVACASGHHPSLFPLPFVSTFHRSTNQPWLPTYLFSQPAVHFFSKQPRRLLRSRAPPDPPVRPLLVVQVALVQVEHLVFLVLVLTVIAWTVASVLQRGRPRSTTRAPAHLNRTAARTAMMTQSDHGASVPRVLIQITPPGDIVQAVLEVHLARRA